MSERSFSRRRRGMRFRPAGGLGHTSQKPTAEAQEARAAATGETTGSDKLFERRHDHEIERAENIAAGLPAHGAPPPSPADAKREFRHPHLETPERVEEIGP